MYDRKQCDMSRKRVAHILYTANASGKARIIFDGRTEKLQGILVGDDGECFTFHGHMESASVQHSATCLMTIVVCDSETGHEFRVENVKVRPNFDSKTGRRDVTLEHPSLSFTTTDWYQGNRADVEIREHINPQMVGCGCEVLVGTMAINLISTCKSKPLSRCVSLSDDATTVVLELSNDFLA